MKNIQQLEDEIISRMADELAKQIDEEIILGLKIMGNKNLALLNLQHKNKWIRDIAVKTLKGEI
jgi:hypothetical protein